MELEDDSGRVWQMTYRCVPHRYSYELRAGWKVGHVVLFTSACCCLRQRPSYFSPCLLMHNLHAGPLVECPVPKHDADMVRCCA